MASRSGTDPAARPTRLRVRDTQGVRELDPFSEEGFSALAQLWSRAAWYRVSFAEVSWLGVRAPRLPADSLRLAELLWDVRPDVVIERGVAFGGTLLFTSSLLVLMGKAGRVIGIDHTVLAATREALAKHPLAAQIELIEGDPHDAQVVRDACSRISAEDRVLLLLDADHSASTMFRDLEIYGPLVSPGSYAVVAGGIISLLTDAPNGQPGWAVENPLVAMDAFLARHPEFERDVGREGLGATFCPGGWLRRRDLLG